jgi:DNA excision repair protein ERCC-5
MGVTGLWPILAPSARPTPLPTLNRKRLAVDASIWIYQFLKAVRDKEGNALRNSHVVGFFRRICKLLYFGIKPVFVFDGGAPALKRMTVLSRKKRREGRREDAVRTAGRLLAVQMKRRGEEEQDQRRRERQRKEAGLSGHDIVEEPLPDEGQMVYVGEVGMSAAERQATRKFRKTDAYHLPDIPNLSEMGAPNDPRIMSAEELEEYARQFNNGEDVNLYDFSKIDFNGEFFLSLPPGDRYNILNAARLRSRLRMGLSKEQLEDMFPDRMAFSRFQIERVRERNELTQRLMNLNGMNDGLLGVGAGRIAGERGREYVLVKNDGVEGGWALGVVSTDKSVGERNKPIDVDALHHKVKESRESSESEEEFEDVPVEGLNRLPKLGPAHDRADAEFGGDGFSGQARHLNAPRNGESTNGKSSGIFSVPVEEPDSLFVDDSMETEYLGDGEEEDEGLARAIAMSLEKDDRPQGETEEEEHLYQAIALSLKKQHGQESESENDADFEGVPMPEYEQRAVAAPKPLTSSSGGMIAHIVNNRANAAVPKRRAASVSSGSESDMDLQALLAKERKKNPPEKPRQPAPAPKNMKNPFDGPLPFERLDFRTSIFAKKGRELERPEVKAGKEEQDEVEEEEDLAGGFDTHAAEEAPKPLPPWLVGNDDIRSRVEDQQRRDLETNAEDRERAIEEERAFRLNHGPIEIESSGDESDVEVLEGPPPPATKMSDLAETVRAEPPVSDIPQERQPPAEPVSVSTEERQELEDEVVDWSESEYGDATKPGVDTERLSDKIARSTSKSASPEFENVGVPQIGAAKSPSPDFEDGAMPEPADTAPQRLPSEDAFDRQQEDMDEFDVSDPDDEELLAQLAVEAEEHARFASTLNNKSERENREAYEKELKALRTQQKKDRRDADEVSHVMITECQALLRLFGIPYITAPMEAEAQCAELVRLGLVDGVVTDDSDIFLFGGTRVYKNMFNSNKFVECYLASDLEKELSLTREQLIAVAHLLGSDYTEGLPGIGPVTAVEIISEFPSASGLEEFKAWWSSAQLSSAPPSTESSAFRKKFRRAQSTKLLLPPGFPSPAVTDAYLHPEVDSSPEPFQWGVPDLDRLREFLMATIGWDQERTDEVLVPVIRDMNRRAAEGTQSNITRFFGGAVGAGVNVAGKGDVSGSRRMREAVGRLKARRKGAVETGETWADKAREWAGRERERGRERAGDDEGEHGEGDGEVEGVERGEGVKRRGKGKGSVKRRKVGG